MVKKKVYSQSDIIARHLKVYGSITAWEAMNRYRIMRLASRVSDLRKSGMDIVTDMTSKDGKRYAVYRLAK